MNHWHSDENSIFKIRGMVLLRGVETPMLTTHIIEKGVVQE